MPVTPRQLYQIKIIGELHGQATETRFWFKSADTSTWTTPQNELTSLRGDFLTNIVPAYKAFCNQNWSAKTMLSVQMTAVPGIFIDDVLSGGGVQTGDSLPSFCAGLLSLRTGLTGRSRVGRIYVPGVAEDLSSNSRLEGAYTSVLQTLGATLLARYGPSGSFAHCRIGVFSRKLGVTRNPGPPPSLSYSINGWTQVTSFIARPEVATQRKRKLARGQ
jgi:hypothetical protein